MIPAKFLLPALLLLASALPVSAAAAHPDDAALRELHLLIEAYKLVRAEYYDTTKLDPAALMAGAVRGMLESLKDPHTRYLTRQETLDIEDVVEGEFGGIGIHIEMENERLTVIAPIEGTPAWKGGIEPGDVIFRIDGDTTTGMTLDSAVYRLRGRPGSKVQLDIERRGRGTPLPVTLTREIIEIKSVRQTLCEKFGYIRISEFSEHTAIELDKALRQLTEKNVPGLILDLRDNSGGVLEAAIAVGHRFLDTGVIVSVVSRHRDQTQVYNATPSGKVCRLPLVILVNGSTASASEIVAGAIQDSRRGVLVGAKTYGKGSVQTLQALPNGSKMRLTTALYFTPSGKSLHGVGAMPDVPVEAMKLSDTDRRALETLADSGILREFVRNRSTYTDEDVTALENAARSLQLSLSREILEMRLVRELSRRNDGKIYLAPHLDPQLRKALDILKATKMLQPKIASTTANP